MRSSIPFIRALILAGLVALVAFFACYLIPESYKGYETLYFPMAQAPSASLSALSGLATRAPSPEPGAVSGLNGAVTSPLVGAGPQTAIGILTSRSAIDYLIKNFDLTHRWHKSYSDAFHKVGSSMSAAADKDSGFVKIAFETTDKKLAVDVVKKLLEYLRLQTDRLSINISHQNRVFIESRLKIALDTRQQREAALVSATKNAPLATSELLQESYFEARNKLSEAEAGLAGAKAKIIAISKSLSRMYAVNGTASDGMVHGEANAATSELAAITQEMANRRLMLEDAMATYRNGAEELSKAKTSYQSVSKLARKIGKERLKGVAEGYDPALTLANGQAAELEATVEGYKQVVNGLQHDLVSEPQSSVLVLRLKADLTAAQEGVTRLEQELSYARIAEERDPSRFEVVDYPALDPDFTWPRKGVIAGVAFALALLIQAFPYLRKLVVFDS